MINRPKAAFNIIYSHGKVFMVQEKDRTWGFPGGGVELAQGETSLEGARREILEETDNQVSLYDYDYLDIIDISIKPSFTVVAFVYSDPSFYAYFPELKKLTNGETLQTKWVPLSEFRKMNLRKKLREKKDEIYQYLKELK